jgi:hypothetical protein
MRRRRGAAIRESECRRERAAWIDCRQEAAIAPRVAAARIPRPTKRVAASLAAERAAWAAAGTAAAGQVAVDPEAVDPEAVAAAAVAAAAADPCVRLGDPTAAARVAAARVAAARVAAARVAAALAAAAERLVVEQAAPSRPERKPAEADGAAAGASPVDLVAARPATVDRRTAVVERQEVVHVPAGPQAARVERLQKAAAAAAARAQQPPAAWVMAHCWHALAAAVAMELAMVATAAAMPTR